MELLLAYINIHKAFFHQGHELLSIDTEGDFNSITSQVKPLGEVEFFFDVDFDFS